MRLSLTSCLFVLNFILNIQLLTAQPVDPALAGMSEERLAHYTNYLQQEIDAGRAPGFVSMVYRNGYLTHYEALGYSNVDDQKAMIADNIFSIVSMTKAVVSTAFMMLYEEGHFQLNDPVYWYLPEFQNSRVAIDPTEGKQGDTEPAKGPIRIIHLLTHTSGLSHGLGPSKLDQDYRQAMYLQPVTIAERVQAIASLPLVGHPGEQWYYSASPGVLSRLVEHFLMSF